MIDEDAWQDRAFGVDVFASGDFAHVAVFGEVDLVSASTLRDRLHEILDAGAADVVVDLSGVSFIGSAGLGVLAGTLNELRPWNGHLVVRNASRTARRLLEILGLERGLLNSDVGLPASAESDSLAGWAGSFEGLPA